MARQIPSKHELIELMRAKIVEARDSLRAAAEVMPLSAEQREEYEKLMDALDALERRIQGLRE